MVLLNTFALLNLIEIIILVIVGILIYRYFKGSVAFYILFGLMFVYLFSLFLSYVGFNMLSKVFDEFSKYGFIAILIIFQPELRNILMSIGNNRFSRQIRKIRNSIFESDLSYKNQTIIDNVTEAVQYLSDNKIGAIIVFFEMGDYSNIINTGITINGKISSKLIESIFVKESPLHDGAIIIQSREIKAASCVLPISQKLDLPERIGLRHKSAVGVTEVANAISIIVSETTGIISLAREGHLESGISMEELSKQIDNILNA